MARSRRIPPQRGVRGVMGGRLSRPLDVVRAVIHDCEPDDGMLYVRSRDGHHWTVFVHGYDAVTERDLVIQVDAPKHGGHRACSLCGRDLEEVAGEKTLDAKNTCELLVDNVRAFLAG